MNSKSVLGKILTLLSLDEAEVNFTDAKTADGTILQSPTFDVGESVEVVSEDGTKSPAPDGEHEISLRDSEGNDVLIKVITKDGKIVERENVELEDMPEEEVVDKEAEIKDEADVEMADATTVEAHPLPMTTDEDPRNSLGDDTDESKDPLISLGYRISELEKMVADMKIKMGEESPVDEEAQIEEEPAVEDEAVAMAEVEEEELPKLDGAPLETAVKFNSDAVHKPNNYGKKVGNSQNSFLSKLYS